MEAYDLLQRERAAYLVSQAEKVLWIVDQELGSMLEQDACLVVGRIVRNVLHCVEAELVVKALDEVVERCRRIFTDQKHVPYL